MKKLISILLMSVLIIGICCGCGSDDNATSSGASSGKKEEIEWMPNGLKFGMTYDDAKAVHPEIPELEDAKANDGYACSFESPDNDTALKYFGFDTYCEYFNDDASAASHRLKDHFGGDLRYAYSFNQDKELYEFYVFYYCLNEASAEHMLNGFLTYYLALTATDENEIEEIENDSELTCRWEKDGVRISIQLIEDEDYDGSFTLAVVLHNIEYDLNS